MEPKLVSSKVIMIWMLVMLMVVAQKPAAAAATAPGPTTLSTQVQLGEDCHVTLSKYIDGPNCRLAAHVLWSTLQQCWQCLHGNEYSED